MIDDFRGYPSALRIFELGEAHATVGRVELQLKRHRLASLLLLAGETREAVGEGVGDEEFHSSIIDFHQGCASRNSYGSFPYSCLRFSPVFIPWPPHDVGVARRRFLRNDVQLLVSDITGGEDGRPVQRALFAKVFSSDLPELITRAFPMAEDG